MKKTFEEYLKSNGLNKKSILQYKSQLRQFLTNNGYDIGIKDSVRIDQINMSDDNIIQMCREFCFKNKYIYIRKAVMVHFLKYINKKHLIHDFRYGTLALNDYKLKNTNRKTIEYSELKKLLDELPEEMSLIIRCQFECSFRISEVLDLIYPDHISVKNGRIMINTKQKGGSGVVGFLSKETSNLFMNYFNNNPKKGKIFNISYSKFERDLVNLSQKILGKKVTTHWFKHQKFDYLANILKKNPFEIKEALNHKRIETTMKYYRRSGIQEEKIIEEMEKNKVY